MFNLLAEMDWRWHLHIPFKETLVSCSCRQCSIYHVEYIFRFFQEGRFVTVQPATTFGQKSSRMGTLCRLPPHTYISSDDGKLALFQKTNIVSLRAIIEECKAQTEALKNKLGTAVTGDSIDQIWEAFGNVTDMDSARLWATQACRFLLRKLASC